MKPRTIVYLVVLVALAVFVLANLDVVTTPTRLNLLATSVTAPLGVVILVIAGTILLLDLAAHQLAAMAWRRDQRQLTEQLETMRRRADDAEEARIGDLRRLVEREMAALRGQVDRVLDAVEMPQDPVARRYLPPQRNDDQARAATADVISATADHPPTR
jgi:uncharacterized integral membrane protein